MTKKSHLHESFFVRQAKQRDILAAMWAMFPQEIEQHQMSSKRLALLFDNRWSYSDIDFASRLFERAGVVTKRSTWGANGREGHWTFHGTFDMALNKLAAAHAVEAKEHDHPPKRPTRSTLQLACPHCASTYALQRNLDKHLAAVNYRPTPFLMAPKEEADLFDEDVALAKDDHEEVRASAGPTADSPLKALAPLRKLDDPEAAVALARQYKDRTKTIMARLDDLATIAAEYGIEFDRDKMNASMKVEVDPMMEGIVAILPYIDRLEGRVKSLGNNVADQREKAKGYDTLAREVDRLREQNRRLISEKVSAAAASQSFRAER